MFENMFSENMDKSAFVIDKTLPIDFNESSNPDLLTEVTYGEVGIMEKSTGRMSPVRGRTMREYEQQMGELRKENFDLKLRIYYMEEKITSKFTSEDIIKQNIELKVEMESYKKDIIDKQALLNKASETIETMTSKYSEELEREVKNIKQECEDKVAQANQHAFEMEEQYMALADTVKHLEEQCDEELKPKLELKEKQLEEMTDELDEKEREVCDLQGKANTMEAEIQRLREQVKHLEDEKQEEKEYLQIKLTRKDRDLQRLSFMIKEQTSIEGVEALERSRFQDEVDDTKRQMEKLQKNLDKKVAEGDRKNDMIAKLEDLLRAKEKALQGLQGQFNEQTIKYTRSKEIIADLTKNLHHKDEEINNLKEKLNRLLDENEALKQKLRDANLARQKMSLSPSRNEPSFKEDAEKIHELEDQLEKLMRTLGKKEGELENFKDLLDKAQNSLTKSQEVVEDLEERLKAERCKCKERAGDKKVKGDSGDDDTSRLRHQLADLHIQLEEQAKQYQSKCQELDMVAQKLNIKVTTQTDKTDHSDMLQRIMGELQQLKGAVESEKHFHIDINSTHNTSPQKESFNTRDLDIVRPGSTNIKSTIGGKNGNHIPVHTKAPSTEECDSLRKQVADLKAQVHHLENTLKATEETVHCQTQKMKHYRNMLIENGLLPRSRSNSVSDLPSARNNRSMTRKMSADSVAPRCRSMSPSHVGRKHVDNYDELDRLVKNNNKLKEQVEGYQRVLKVFQSRSPSPNEKLDKSGEKVPEDGESASMSFESAFCVLKSWFEMLDKYLVERSESHLPSSSSEVSRLRRGLTQAREAIKSLSDTALDQDKLSEGRLSPDSGCSDNPASAQNTLKETPSNSPTSRQSTSPRFTVTSPDTMTRLVHNDSNSKETYRHASAIPSVGNMSMFSHIDPTSDNTSVFSTASTKSKTAGHFQPELISPPPLPNFNVDRTSSVSQPRHLQNKHLNSDHLDHSFMPKLLDESSMADITNIGQHSLIKFEDASLLDISSYDGQHYRSCMAEMQEQIKTLTDKYENQIRQQARPDMDTLQQQLAELRELRIQLEKALAWNAVLEKHLYDLQKSSESTIHELRSKLEESEHNITEKVQIIQEKEKIISESRITLDKYKDNSSKDNERVRSLEDMCAQLRNAVEQYKKRCTQLQEDNKSHMAAVSRYQSKVKDLEEDVISEQRSKVEGLKARVDELEREVEMREGMEVKYKNYLEQTRLQVTKLTGELEVKGAELDKSTSELYNVKMELESLRDVVEEQNQQLGDKTTLIDKLDRDMKVKDMCLSEQDSLCRDLTSKLELVTTSNSKLSSQLDQHREACGDYKRQIEEQSAITKDLREQIDQLRDKLAISMEQRDAQDKLLQEKDNLVKETTRVNEKYLYNLKVRYKQCLNYKKELSEAKKKCEDTSVLNNTLQTELSVRQQLMENQGDMLTDDDKHRMIQQLLNELRLASIQMTKILQQNENIKQKMMELIEQKKQELNRISGDKASGRKTSESVEKFSFEDSQDDSFGSNQTWPLFDDLTDGLPRTDNLSTSLPLGTRKSGARQQEGKNPLEPYLTKQMSKEEPAGGLGNSGNQFSVPGPIYKQGITDDCLMYNVNDSPKYLQGLTQVRIDSDNRSLFAIGMIDHYEKLRKETNESNVILKGLSTRVTERLKVFNTMPALESPEYGIMKEISYAVENLRICVDSQLSLVGFFWTSELPCPNEKGEFVNQKLLDRNAALREEVSRLRERSSKGSSGQLGNDDMLCERLESTLNVMSRARHNLEYSKQKHRPISPHRSPSHSPRK